MAKERNLKTFLQARKAKALKAQERAKELNKKPIERELAKGNLTDSNNMKITTKKELDYHLDSKEKIKTNSEQLKKYSKKRSFKKRVIERTLELER